MLFEGKVGSEGMQDGKKSESGNGSCGGQEFTLEDLLAAREERLAFQSGLLVEFNSALVVGRVNYPGLRKTNAMTLAMIEDLNELLRQSFAAKVQKSLIRQGAEGPIVYLSVNDEAQTVKEFTVKLEMDHPLGRCWDLDVYDSQGRSLSREDLGYPPRTCFLCDNPAHVCVRSQRHSFAEVVGFIEEKFIEYKDKEIRDKEIRDKKIKD